MWQYDFRGGTVPQKLNLLVCTRTCLDDLSYSQMLQILPPDPPPQFNLRPEPFAVDETNWLTTQDDEDIITTESDDPLITSLPNPDTSANICNLIARIASFSDEITSVAYLDLFNGNPEDGGTSILATVTGSATRTNIYDDLAAIPPSLIGIHSGLYAVQANPDVIVITSASLATVNITHAGIYDAATGGNLLVSGAVGAAVTAPYPTIVEGAAVQFLALDLSIQVTIAEELLWGADSLYWNGFELFWEL